MIPFLMRSMQYLHQLSLKLEHGASANDSPAAGKRSVPPHEAVAPSACPVLYRPLAEVWAVYKV